MKTINPTPEQMEGIRALPDNTPFVMVNLLKFTSRTPDGDSGRTAYQRYAKNTAPLLSAIGGRVIWGGETSRLFIGTEDKAWDWVLLVEYPSKTAFLTMISDPEYQAIHQDRERGLEDSTLMACRTLFQTL